MSISQKVKGGRAESEGYVAVLGDCPGRPVRRNWPAAVHPLNFLVLHLCDGHVSPTSNPFPCSLIKVFLIFLGEMNSPTHLLGSGRLGGSGPEVDR